MIRTERLGAYVVLAAVLFLPLVTWVPLTIGNSFLAVKQTPYWLTVILGVLLVACWVGTVDGILGLIVGYAALRGITATYPGTFPGIFDATLHLPHVILPDPLYLTFAIRHGTLEPILVMALGAIVIVTMRHVSKNDAKYALLVMAGMQLWYLLWQAQGMDPIWRGDALGTMRLFGTIGQENYVGWVLGCIAPLAHIWLVPVFLIGIALTHNLTGLVALVAGWMRNRGYSWAILGWMGLGLVILASLWPPQTFDVRVTIWQSAMLDQDGWTWLVGHGWGGWIERMPLSHPQVTILNKEGMGENFLQAHNEWLQLYYEAGIIGLCLVGWWLWSHRDKWVGPWGGAAVACFVVDLAGFPLHVAIPGLIQAVIVGVALQPQTPSDLDRIP